MEFNFDEVFKRNMEVAISKITPELELMKKRQDEYDGEYMVPYLSNMATSISLAVTKSVFEEYHQFLMQKISESR